MLIWLGVGIGVVSILVWVFKKPKVRPPPKMLNLYYLRRKP